MAASFNPCTRRRARAMRRYASAREDEERNLGAEGLLRQRKGRRDGRGKGCGDRRRVLSIQGVDCSLKGTADPNRIRRFSQCTGIAQWPTCVSRSRDSDSDAEITADFAHRAGPISRGGSGVQRGSGGFKGGREEAGCAMRTRGTAISFGFDWRRLMSRTTRV